MMGLHVGRCPKIFGKLAKAHHTLPLRFSIVLSSGVDHNDEYAIWLSLFLEVYFYPVILNCRLHNVL